MSAKLLLLASLLVSISAFAYPPPEITAAGLTLRIEGLDQGARPKKADWDRRKINVREYDAARPLPLVFTLSNATDRVVRGDFTVWMNDDWEVEGGESEKIEVQAGAVVTRTRTAKALENVLPALYPVHARFVAEDGTELHPIAVIRAKTPNRAFTLTPRFRAQIYEGAWRLDSGFDYTVTMEVGGKRREVADKRKSDPVSNGSFVKSSGAGFDNGVPARRGFCSHPPYMTGAGAVYADFTVELPSAKPIIFRFANALSNAGKDKNPGDGVVTSVFARPEGGEMREVFTQAVPASGVWQEGRVDLSEYAGKKITLRLKGDPGPQGNTAWDSYAWGDPVIEVGEVPAPTDEAGWLVRERAATEKAFKALEEGADSRAGTYLLTADGDAYGAGVEYGPAGLLDAVIAFTDGKSASVAIRGFELEVDGEALTCLKSAPAVRGQVYAEQGALKVAWDTRSARKTSDGSPRFTRLTTGRATHRAKRVYGGTGAVWEDLDRLKLLQSGFALSTRHVGFEFTNGLALVEATDVPCDYLEVDTSNRIARLVTHNDAVFAFVPSSRGAFDAARRFAKVSGYKTSPGFKAMLGKT
ncbi:MAG: hypothetical protein PHV28_15805, partial [Kiritimatiellae bacterium]|nr:hypothetical protein [Kiritimatiellia bacterium]